MAPAIARPPGWAGLARCLQNQLALAQAVHSLAVHSSQVPLSGAAPAFLFPDTTNIFAEPEFCAAVSVR